MPGVVTTENGAFVCHFYLKPECREQFLAEFDALWRGSLDFMNENCNLVFYGFGRDPNEFVAIESYRNEAVVAELRASEQFQEIVGKLLGYCSKSMVLDIYSGLDADRSIFDLYPAGESKYHPRNGDVRGIFS